MNLNPHEKDAPDQMDWLLWAALSMLGYTLAGLMFHFPSGFPPNNGSDYNASAFIGGALIGGMSGLIIGGLQALLLRKYFNHVRSWIAANIVAFAIIHAIGDALPDGFALLTVQTIGGMILGIALSRPVEPSNARVLVWMIVVAVAWFAGLTSGLMINNQLGVGWQMGHVVVGITAGIAVAIATGAWLIQHVRLANSRASVAMS